MGLARRLCVFVLLLALLIPTTVLSQSGDGDIPEHRFSACTGNGGPFDMPEGEFDWNAFWGWIVKALALLP